MVSINDKSIQLFRENLESLVNQTNSMNKSELEAALRDVKANFDEIFGARPVGRNAGSQRQNRPSRLCTCPHCGNEHVRH